MGIYRWEYTIGNIPLGIDHWEYTIGNLYRGVGNVIKMNGGAHNTIDSLLVIEGDRLGFANCRGLRGNKPADYYTCENEGSGQRWLKILEEVDYLGPVWHARWPWHTGRCSHWRDTVRSFVLSFVLSFG